MYACACCIRCGHTPLPPPPPPPPPPCQHPKSHTPQSTPKTGGGLALQPAVNARGLLLDEGPLDSDRLPAPSKYRLVSSLGRARVMGAFTLNQMRCETVILRFSRAEVEAVKARAMAPLEGALDGLLRRGNDGSGEGKEERMTTTITNPTHCLLHTPPPPPTHQQNNIDNRHGPVGLHLQRPGRAPVAAPLRPPPGAQAPAARRRGGGGGRGGGREGAAAVVRGGQLPAAAADAGPLLRERACVVLFCGGQVWWYLSGVQQ